MFAFAEPPTSPAHHAAVMFASHRAPYTEIGYRTRVPVRELMPPGEFPFVGRSGTILGRVSTLPGSIAPVLGETYDKDLGVFFIVASTNTGEAVWELTPQGVATQFSSVGNNSVPGIVYSPLVKKLYYTDDWNYRVVQVDPVTSQTTVFAGGCQGTTDGKGAAACFQQPQGIAADPTTGTLYLADYDRIRQITPDGTVTTITAPGSIGPYYQYGQGSEGVAFDTHLNRLYVSDPPNQLIHVVTLKGVISTYTGQCVVGQYSGCAQYQRDGALSAALFSDPTGLCYSPTDQSLYVADSDNDQIRKIQGGNVSTLAGNGHPGDVNGVGIVPSFAVPISIAQYQKNSQLFVGEEGSGFVRTVTTLGSPPPPPPHGTTLYDPTTAGSAPYGIAIKADGTIWFTENGAAKIGEMTAPNTFTEFPLPSGFSQPTNITIGSDGNVWFADLYGTVPNQTPSIGRLDSTGTITQYALPGYQVQDLTLGQDGNVWFVLGGGGMGDITPSGTVETFGVTPAFGLAYGFDNAIWTLGRAVNSGNAFVARYATDGAQLSYVEYPGVSNPMTIHRGKSSRMWMADSDALGVFYGKQLIEYELPPPCQGCRTRSILEFAVDPAGYFWLAEGIGYLGRFSTSGTVTDYLIAAPRSRPTAVTIAPDGTVWFADQGSDRIGKWY